MSKQFSKSTQFSSIWPIDRTLSGATSPSQRGPGRMPMKGCSVFPKAQVLLEPHHQIVYCHIQGTRLVKEAYPSAGLQSVNSTAPADWPKELTKMLYGQYIYIYMCVCVCVCVKQSWKSPMMMSNLLLTFYLWDPHIAMLMEMVHEPEGGYVESKTYLVAFHVGILVSLCNFPPSHMFMIIFHCLFISHYFHILFTNPSTRAGYDTRSISLSGV